jgi:hypothetical protein
MIKLLDGVTATTAAPSAATDGFSLRKPTPGTEYVWSGQNIGQLNLYSTAGSGTMTATVRMWGYKGNADRWFPLGTSTTESERGLINGGAVDEDGADNLVSSTLIQGLSGFDRIAAQVVAIGGTSTAIDLDLDTAVA